MDKSKVSGDSKIVMGSPMAKEEKTIVIPPEKSGMKIIEEGPIELKVEKNTPEIIAALEKQQGKGGRE